MDAPLYLTAVRTSKKCKALCQREPGAPGAVLFSQWVMFFGGEGRYISTVCYFWPPLSKPKLRLMVPGWLLGLWAAEENTEILDNTKIVLNAIFYIAPGH